MAEENADSVPKIGVDISDVGLSEFADQPQIPFGQIWPVW